MWSWIPVFGGVIGCPGMPSPPILKRPLKLSKNGAGGTFSLDRVGTEGFVDLSGRAGGGGGGVGGKWLHPS